MRGKHLVIVRTGGSIIDFNSYNCQELGLAKALSKEGIIVSLVLAGNENRLTEVEYAGHTINVYQKRYKSINQALAWFDDIEELLHKIKPDILQIHEFGMLMSWRIVKWAKKNRTPVVLIQGSYRPTQKVLFKQMELLFNRTFGKYVLNNVSAIGAKTPSARRYIDKYTSRSVYLTPIGLDISKFKSSIDVDWRSRLKIAPNTKIMLYVGALEYRRNPIFLIDILAELHDDYILVIAGEGPLLNDIRKMLKQKSLIERCYLLGKIPQVELPSLYRQSEVFALVSDYEIYGMVMLEAMYFGVPVLSTITAGSESVIIDGVDGFLINEKIISLWVKKIRELDSNEELRKKLSGAAKDKICNNLVWDSVAKKYIDLYSIVSAQ